MISFLFWNLNKREETIPYIARLAITYRVDVFLFAECPSNTQGIVEGLNAAHRGIYREASGIKTKVRVFSRLAPEHLTPRFSSLEMTIWELKADNPRVILLAAVHLPSKAGGFLGADQQAVAGLVAADIAKFEDQEGCRDTLVVGDLNMNPFDPGMVVVTGFHALMARDLAARPDWEFRGRKFRCFYNPMWGLFGDRTPGPAGTYYWDSSVPSNQHWHMLDQVLLRPSLMGRLSNLQILAGDGYQSLLTSAGITSKDHVSDHLPILFQIDI